MLELPAELSWPVVDGAVEYRVQVWDGTRLLFEEVTMSPPLRVTAAMQRSLLGSSAVEVQVRASAVDGERIGETWRYAYPHPERKP